MKRIASVLVALLIMSLCACSSSGQATSSESGSQVEESSSAQTETGVALGGKATFGEVSFEYPADWEEPSATSKSLVVGTSTPSDEPGMVVTVYNEFNNQPSVAPLNQDDDYYGTLADMVNLPTSNGAASTMTSADPWTVERADNYVMLTTSHLSRSDGGAEWYGIKAVIFTADQTYLFDEYTDPDDLAQFLPTMEAIADSITVS